MNKQILTITSAIAMAFSLVEAKAADMTATFFQEYALWGNNASGLTLWVGNFGSNGGSLLSTGQVQTLAMTITPSSTPSVLSPASASTTEELMG